MAKEASKEIAPVLNGLTRFMVNPPEIEKSLGAGRAALLCLLFESPSQTAHPLNRFVDESRKNVSQQKGEAKLGSIKIKLDWFYNLPGYFPLLQSLKQIIFQPN